MIIDIMELLFGGASAATETDSENEKVVW